MLQERRCHPAFTLIELLVAMTVLLIIMLAVVVMVNQTSRLWRQSTARVESFQGARAAFESMTRKLSQSTLNTYWDYSYPGGDRTLPPGRYVTSPKITSPLERNRCILDMFRPLSAMVHEHLIVILRE